MVQLARCVDVLDARRARLGLLRKCIATMTATNPRALIAAGIVASLSLSLSLSQLNSGIQLPRLSAEETLLLAPACVYITPGCWLTC